MSTLQTVTLLELHAEQCNPVAPADGERNPCCAAVCVVCAARSLFEKDKLLFSFSLAFKLKLDAGLISHQELRFLMTGACLFSPCWRKPKAAP